MAYIDLKNGFNEALQLSGSEIGGWNIMVQEARPRDSGEGSFSNDRPGRNEGGRFSNRRPGGRSSDRAPRGRSSRPGRGPSKPSLISSSQGLFPLLSSSLFFLVVSVLINLYFCMFLQGRRQFLMMMSRKLFLLEMALFSIF